LDSSHQPAARRKSGKPLNPGVSPCTGAEREGVTAAIKSACKLSYEKVSNGASLTLHLSGDVLGAKGRDVIKALLKSFIELGGCIFSSTSSMLKC